MKEMNLVIHWNDIPGIDGMEGVGKIFITKVIYNPLGFHINFRKISIDKM